MLLDYIRLVILSFYYHHCYQWHHRHHHPHRRHRHRHCQHCHRQLHCHYFSNNHNQILKNRQIISDVKHKRVTYLESENNTPHETKNSAGLPIHDVKTIYADQLYLKKLRHKLR